MDEKHNILVAWAFFSVKKENEIPLSLPIQVNMIINPLINYAPSPQLFFFSCFRKLLGL
jgi:hypothetical protein